MECSLIFLSLSPPNASQTAPGWSSLRSCCCSRLLSISFCHLVSSALPAARILCWRALLPIAPPQGTRGRTCGGKGLQSPPARLPTWVSDGFCWPLRRDRDKMETVDSTKESHLRQELIELFRAALGLVLNKGARPEHETRSVCGMYCNTSGVCTAAGGDCSTGRSHSVFTLPGYSSEPTKGKSDCLSTPNITASLALG